MNQTIDAHITIDIAKCLDGVQAGAILAFAGNVYTTFMRSSSGGRTV